MADTPQKILIVEDELIIAMMIQKMVQGMGHEVIDIVTTGEEAVERAKSSNPDLILMDIRLQGEMDGIDAMSEIKRTMEIPVIYITGNSDQCYRDRARETGYIEFLTKPVTRDQLSRSFSYAYN